MSPNHHKPYRLATALWALTLTIYCSSLSGCGTDDTISLDPERARYSLQVENVHDGQRVFVDLNNDGIDEMLDIVQGGNGNSPAIVAMEGTGPVIDQVNFFHSRHIAYFFAQDFNGDGDRDLFVVSEEDDTIFACIVDMYHSHHSSFLRKIPLIVKPDSLDRIPSGTTALLVGLVANRKTPDGILLCVFKSSFSLQPRGVAAFSTTTGKRLWYYPTGADVSQVVLADVNGDDLPEIFAGSTAPDNGAQVNGTDDDHSYVIGLGLDGKPLWPARQLGGAFSRAYVCPADLDNDGNWELYCLFSSGNKFDQKSFVEVLDPKTGKPLGKRRDFAEELTSTMDMPAILEQDGRQVLVAGLRDGSLLCLDAGLTPVLRRRLPARIADDLSIVDADLDGRRELSVPLSSRQTMLLDESLQPLALESGMVTFSPVRTGRTGERRIAINGENQTIVALMESNPGMLRLWGWRVGMMALLFAGVSALFVVLYRGYFYLRLFTTMSGNAARVGILVINRKGKIIHTNAAMHAVTGLPSEPCRGRMWRECLGTDALAPLRDLIGSLMVGGTSTRAGRRFDLIVDSNPVNLIVRCYPVAAGMFRAGWLIILGDITEALQSDRMLNWAVVAQNLAHEMKTPLSTIWFTLERIRQQTNVAASEPLGGHLASIEEEVRRVDTYVKGFMKLASVNPPNLQPVELNDVVGNLLSTYAGKLPQSVTVQKSLSPELPPVRLDVKLFTVAATNLFDNAVTAMRGKGTLKVSTYVARNLKEHSVVLSVSDTGSGIAKEDYPRIFQPYFTRNEGGTGLGLVITKKIVEDHGGRIHFITATGLGTEFIVHFPVSAADMGGNHA